MKPTSEQLELFEKEPEHNPFSLQYDEITRFDLEEAILECWNFEKELKLLLKKEEISKKDIEAIMRVSNLRFENLWAIFEELISRRIIE